MFIYNLFIYSIVYNSQDMEAAKMSIGRWLHEAMWYIFIVDNYSVRKRNLVICDNMDRSRKWKTLGAKLCLTLCDPMNCSPPGFSVRGILQARILEWVAMSSSRGSSQARDWTQISCSASRLFAAWTKREAQHLQCNTLNEISQIEDSHLMISLIHGI